MRIKTILLRFILYTLWQNVRETLFDDYRMGGINLTNFNLVDYTNKSVKHYMDAWRQKSPEVRGTNLTKIPVSLYKLYSKMTLSRCISINKAESLTKVVRNKYVAIFVL